MKGASKGELCRHLEAIEKMSQPARQNNEILNKYIDLYAKLQLSKQESLSPVISRGGSPEKKKAANIVSLK